MTQRDRRSCKYDIISTTKLLCTRESKTSYINLFVDGFLVSRVHTLDGSSQLLDVLDSLQHTYVQQIATLVSTQNLIK